jgi:hypothetical protein
MPGPNDLKFQRKVYQTGMRSRQALDRIIQEMAKRGRLERALPVGEVLRDEAVREAYREVSSRAELKPAFDMAMAVVEKYGFQNVLRVSYLMQRFDHLRR